MCILSHGDMWILRLVTNDLKVQGMYLVLHNYGGLVIRLFFQPVERASFIKFNKNCARPDDAWHHLCLCLKVNLCSSLFLVFVSPFCIPLLVTTVLGAMWQDLIPCFVLYCMCYLPVLLVQGTVDTFKRATAPKEVFSGERCCIFIESIIYIITGIFFTHQLGLGGLVLANTFKCILQIRRGILYLVDGRKQHSYQCQQKNLCGLFLPFSIMTSFPVLAFCQLTFNSLGNPYATIGIACFHLVHLWITEQNFLRRFALFVRT